VKTKALHLSLLLGLTMLSGCPGQGNTTPGTVTGIEVVAPVNAVAGAITQLTANVIGTGNFNKGVSWSLVSGNASLSPVAEANAQVIVLFGSQKIVLQATSKADASKTATVEINVPLQKTLASGLAHSLVLKNGKLIGWGDDSNGELGQPASVRIRPKVIPLASDIVPLAVSAGANHSLLLTRKKQVFAMGRNNYGQLGVKDIEKTSQPILVEALKNEQVVDIIATDYASLALTDQGKVFQWGISYYGAERNKILTPTLVTLDQKVVAIAARNGHGFALTNQGEVFAWGNNFKGELGDGSTKDSLVPVKTIFPAGLKVASIACGSAHAVALMTNGEIYTWGHNYFGQLGRSTEGEADDPHPIPAPTGFQPSNNRAYVLAGETFSIIVSKTGDFGAWGRNYEGQLGENVPSRLFVVGVGDRFVTAQNENGVYAWGNNQFGQALVGLPLTVPRATLIPLPE
jgi:alpha-tubulin suppressor-like RCC1 family protein